LQAAANPQTAGESPTATPNAAGTQRASERNPSRNDGQNSNKSQRPILGVRLGPSPTVGVHIREVLQESNAARAGLRSGDYILSINGRRVSSTDDVDQALAGIEPGSDADFGIWRGGENQQLKLNFAERRQAGFRGEDDEQGNQNERRNRNDQTGRNANDRQDQANRRGSDERQHRGWLGVMVINPNQSPPSNPSDAPQKGVLVRGVYPSGPASRAVSVPVT